MCADAPDTSGMNAAAEASAKISQEALDWAKQLYNETAPEREAAAQRAQQVSDAQLDAMRTATKSAQDFDRYNQEVFRPLEKGIVEDAKNYDTPDREEQAAGKAAGDVQAQAAAARAEGARDLTRSGVNPSDGAYGAMARTMDINTALGSADAMNKARTQVQTIGRAMKMDAASLGRGLPSAQATQAGLAVSAGNSSAANGMQPIAATQAGANIMQTGFGQGMQGQQISGNLYGNIAKIQQDTDAANSGFWGGVGNVAGRLGAAYITSDEDEKTSKKPASDDEALEAVRETPNLTWTYKEDSPAADGGKRHLGPMAQRVAASMGTDVAPGGKKIDLVSMNGVTLGAVRALDKKVSKIAAAAGIPA